MPLKRLLFLFGGRLNRKPYVLWTFSLGLVSAAMSILQEAVLQLPAVASLALLLLMMLCLIVVTWSSLALAVKRLHDLNWSAWMVLGFFVPIINIALAFYLWFARGTRGFNRFGDDPLGNKPDKPIL